MINHIFGIVAVGYAISAILIYWFRPNRCMRTLTKGIGLTIVIAWCVLWVIMSFGLRLEPQHQNLKYLHHLSKNDIRAINFITDGMDVNEIIDYAMRFTSEKLDFKIKKTYEMKAGEGNCITYAAMCTAVANQAFRHNKIDARARHDVGTIKLFDIDLCKFAGNIAGGFFKDHDFVTITSADGSYSIDPSIKDITGYDLKTKQK